MLSADNDSLFMCFQFCAANMCLAGKREKCQAVPLSRAATNFSVFPVSDFLHMFE